MKGHFINRSSAIVRCLLLALAGLGGVIETATADSTAASESSVAGSVVLVYPQGNTFPFMGYSGVPARDAHNGFTVAGPSYGKNQKAALSAAKAAGLSYPYMVGIDMQFHAKPPEKPLDLSVEEIKTRITAQVEEVAADQAICWWYLAPEELRPWRKNEMEYLQAVTEAIRAADPLGRPVWMYEPNNREAASLEKTGRFLNVIGKGCYTNLVGYRDNRVWVRWSMEQQTKAIESLRNQGDLERFPIVMPELCTDPDDPAVDHLIPAWARHDIYLGLMGGGKGVAIWSLFPRHEVRRTWGIWYDAYAAIARELTGSLRLGQVFLHGVDQPLVEVTVLEGPRDVQLTKGARNAVEAGNTGDSEKTAGIVLYPALGVKQLAYQGSTYIFLCNSSGHATIKFQSTPLPAGGSVTDVFGYRPLSLTNGRLYGWLGPLEVKCFRCDPE